MGRRLVALGLTFALQAAALFAPLVHAHVGGGHHDHHGAGRIHAHADGHGSHRHPAAGAAIHGEEVPAGLVIRLPLFVAVQGDASVVPVVAEAVFQLPEAAESLMRQRPQVVRSHGPPPTDRTGSRAPPALTVLI